MYSEAVACKKKHLTISKCSLYHGKTIYFTTYFTRNKCFPDNLHLYIYFTAPEAVAWGMEYHYINGTLILIEQMAPVTQILPEISPDAVT